MLPCFSLLSMSNILSIFCTSTYPFPYSFCFCFFFFVFFYTAIIKKSRNVPKGVHAIGIVSHPTLRGLLLCGQIVNIEGKHCLGGDSNPNPLDYWRNTLTTMLQRQIIKIKRQMLQLPT
uniref:Uncharacterized protein n=1 Tax=Cacopsylla melanoneura TaxID=428564 RepID=A0A8D9BSV8_9HEMI